MPCRLIALCAVLATCLFVAAPAIAGELNLEPPAKAVGATQGGKWQSGDTSANNVTGGDLADRVSDLEARRAELDRRNRAPISVEISGSVGAEVTRAK